LGSIQDYSLIIEDWDADPEQVAKAYFNRSERKGAIGDVKGQEADFAEAVSRGFVDGPGSK
jgi:hypothetical protein